MDTILLQCEIQKFSVQLISLAFHTMKPYKIFYEYY